MVKWALLLTARLAPCFEYAIETSGACGGAEQNARKSEMLGGADCPVLRRSPRKQTLGSIVLCLQNFEEILVKHEEPIDEI
jgi:hypothetical protein